MGTYNEEEIKKVPLCATAILIGLIKDEEHRDLQFRKLLSKVDKQEHWVYSKIKMDFME